MHMARIERDLGDKVSASLVDERIGQPFLLEGDTIRFWKIPESEIFVHEDPRGQTIQGRNFVGRFDNGFGIRINFKRLRNQLLRYDLPVTRFLRDLAHCATQADVDSIVAGRTLVVTKIVFIDEMRDGLVHRARIPILEYTD